MVMTDILMDKLEKKCEFNDGLTDACESEKQQVWWGSR